MKKQVAIIVSFGLFVMGVLILGLVFYIRKKKSRGRNDIPVCRYLYILLQNNHEAILIESLTLHCSTASVNKKYIHGITEGGNEDMELLKFDLCTISRATDNFSDNYKLGEGGFGPVYKVVTNKT